MNVWLLLFRRRHGHGYNFGILGLYPDGGHASILADRVNHVPASLRRPRPTEIGHNQGIAFLLLHGEPIVGMIADEGSSGIRDHSR